MSPGQPLFAYSPKTRGGHLIATVGTDRVFMAAMIRAGRKRIKPMTIIAACVFTLKKSPTYRLAKDGTMSVWSAFGITGDQAYRIAC
jgi:hypothetical protein